MRYRTRTLFVVVAFFAFFFRAWCFVQTNWLEPRAAGLATQAELDAVVSRRKLDGHAKALFYLERVVLVGEGFTKNEVLGLQKTIEESKWVRLVDVSDANVSSQDVVELQEAFAPILVVGKE